MVGTKPARWINVALASAAILMTIVLGVKLRLADPLSSPVIPAEDPYTHMALVREHLRDGNIGPLNPPGFVYPPGLHGFLAAAWIYTGADLYELFRLGPVLFGAIAILGIALLLWRFQGPIAAFAGALAFAVAPETIFRTTMMAPTALDLAVLPFLFFALLEVLRGRLAWTGVAAPLALFLVFAHPWLLTVVALAGLVFGVAALAFPWPASRGPAPTGPGLAAAFATVGVAWGLSLGGCWGACSGNPDTLSTGARAAQYAPLVVIVSLLPAVLVAVWPRALDWLAPRDRRPGQTLPLALKLAASACLATALVVVTVPALRQGLPEFVNLPHMFGWPIVAMAGLGLVILPFVPGPGAYLGAAVAVVTYPFVMYNPLNSPFLPHRTAVYLGFGLCLLVGVAAAGLARAAAFGLEAAARAAPYPPSRRARPLMAVLPALFVAISLGGSVYAATPPSNTWYRLYPDCQFDALREVATIADGSPTAIVVTGSWQSKLVIAALGNDASRIWYKPDFFQSTESRNGLLKSQAQENRPLIVVVDGYFKSGTPGGDTSFLESSPWQRVVTSCGAPGIRLPAIVAYMETGAKP